MAQMSEASGECVAHCKRASHGRWRSKASLRHKVLPDLTLISIVQPLKIECNRTAADITVR